eukprot:6207847-Pleurochrysis_carterae.AAC.2
MPCIVNRKIAKWRAPRWYKAFTVDEVRKSHGLIDHMKQRVPGTCYRLRGRRRRARNTRVCNGCAYRANFPSDRTGAPLDSG